MEKEKKQYNNKTEVITDIFKKKTLEMWSRSQIIDYLQTRYNYTYHSSLSYYEDMMQILKEQLNTDYESNLAQSIEWLEHNIRNEENSFVRLQWTKELNKVKGLNNVHRVQVDGQINHISTIKLTTVLNPSEQPKTIEFTEQEALPEPNQLNQLITPIQTPADTYGEEEAGF